MAAGFYHHTHTNQDLRLMFTSRNVKNLTDAAKSNPSDGKAFLMRVCQKKKDLTGLSGQ